MQVRCDPLTLAQHRDALHALAQRPLDIDSRGDVGDKNEETIRAAVHGAQQVEDRIATQQADIERRDGSVFL